MGRGIELFLIKTFLVSSSVRPLEARMDVCVREQALKMQSLPLLLPGTLYKYLDIYSIIFQQDARAMVVLHNL